MLYSLGLSDVDTSIERSDSVTSEDAAFGVPNTNELKTVGRSAFFDQLQWEDDGQSSSTPQGQQPEADDVFKDFGDLKSSLQTPSPVESPSPGMDMLIDIAASPAKPSGINQAKSSSANQDKLRQSSISPLSDSELPEIQLIDPFESLASSRTTDSNVPIPNSRGSTNVDSLLDFEPDAGGLDVPLSSGLSKSPSIPLGFDLLSSAKQGGTSDKDSVDLFSNLPSKKNRSLDDLSINSDDGGKHLDDHLKPKQPFDPFMKHFHNSPKKSSSESNLLADWGDTISTETLQPEPPASKLSHSSSSSNLPGGQAPVYDPFAEFGNLRSSASPNPGYHAPSPSMPRTSPNPMQQQSKLPTPQPSATPITPMAPNYNVFVAPSSTTGFFGGTQQGGGSASGNWGMFKKLEIFNF